MLLQLLCCYSACADNHTRVIPHYVCSEWATPEESLTHLHPGSPHVNRRLERAWPSLTLLNHSSPQHDTRPNVPPRLPWISAEICWSSWFIDSPASSPKARACCCCCPGMAAFVRARRMGSARSQANQSASIDILWENADRTPFARLCQLLQT